MSVSWYAKLESGFHANRKARKAGREGREVFVFVLCMNAARGSQGWIPAEDLDAWYLCDQLQYDSEAEAKAAVAKAVEAGLITMDAERVEICGWSDDYAKRPKTRAEIQSDYRSRKGSRQGGQQGERYDDEVTSYRSSNALPRKEGRKGEREGGGNGSLSGSASGSPDAPEAPSAPDTRPRRTRTPDEAGQPLSSTWQPSEALAAVAHSLGLDPAHELAQFRLNARARGHRFVDPDAAFEKFMRGSRDKGKSAPRKPKPGATTRQQRPGRVVLENGLTVEISPDGSERCLNPDGTEHVPKPRPQDRRAAGRCISEETKEKPDDA